MKFLEQITRKKDNVIFKIGDKVFGIGAGEYYIGAIYENDRCESGICIAGYKNRDNVDKYISSPENTECGFNDLNTINKI